MPTKPTVFTIGHSTHSIELFISLLKRHAIEVVADVRSSPFSRYSPQFNRDALAADLQASGIRYSFRGREFGARRDEAQCYVCNRVDFSRVAQLSVFGEGLAWLRHESGFARVALMCAEKEPLDCHRTLLVARHASDFADVRHIIANGDVETHAELELRLLTKCGLAEDDIFAGLGQRLNESYTMRGLEIAYVQSDETNPE